MRRVARIDIRFAQKFEAAARILVRAGPRFDQLRRDVLCMTPQEIEAVRFRAVEREDEKGTVIKALGRLMKIERRFIQITF